MNEINERDPRHSDRIAEDDDVTAHVASGGKEDVASIRVNPAEDVEGHVATIVADDEDVEGHKK